jgi:peptidoglycan/LPS O-acetylase OafA/YrhL
MPHFRIFETWRLLAALLIMMWHFLRYAPPGHETASAALYRLMPLMEMFFMISGFLIMLRYADVLMLERGGYMRFIIRRIARFYPLYLVTLGFFAVIAVAVHLGLVQTDAPERYAFSALLPNILLIQAWGVTDTLTYNYVAWSMSAEWFCYLMLPVIVLAYRIAGKTGLAVTAILSIAALEYAVAAGIIPFPSWLRADTWGAYRAFADFALGALVAIAARDSQWGLRSHAPAWITFGLSVVAMATLQSSYVIVAMLALSMFLAALAERNNADGARILVPLHPIGKVSLGIYLIHPVIESIMFAILWRKLIEPLGVMSFYVYWIVPMLAVVAVAILSERHFETPLANAIGAWAKRRYPPAGDRNAPATPAPAKPSAKVA